MNPEGFRLGGGAAETSILPVTLLLLLVASVLMLFLPRKYVILPFLLASLTIPLGQVIVVTGLHFSAFRVLILVGWASVIARWEVLSSRETGLRINSIDRAMIWWTISTAITFVFLYLNADAFINRMGFLYNTIGGYFLLRFLIREWVDVDRVIKLLAVLCVLIAAFMLVEQATSRNIFAFFGGVSAIVPIRDGRIRSQGPFAHAIIAGTLGATLVPLFVGLWWERKSKKYSILGVLAATVMTIASSSATPLVAFTAGLVALSLWPFRRMMRLIRWGLVFTLVSLHVIMKAPVWALIGRVELVGGSSGDQRYELVNQLMLHFKDWWLLGTKDSGSWGYLMHDTANQYVDIAVTGGLAALVLFISILVRCFRSIGLARKEAAGDPKLERRQWAMGACLFANVIAFIGISYFDQAIIYWYAVVAMISAATLPIHRASHQPDLPRNNSENHTDILELSRNREKHSDRRVRGFAKLSASSWPERTALNEAYQAAGHSCGISRWRA